MQDGKSICVDSGLKGRRLCKQNPLCCKCASSTVKCCHVLGGGTWNIFKCDPVGNGQDLEILYKLCKTGAGSLLLSLCSHNQSLGVDPSGWMFTWFVQICSQPHQICEQPSQVWTALWFVDIWMWSWWFLTGNHWSKVPEWTISVVMLELTIDQVIKAKEWFVSWQQKTKVSDCHCLWLPLTPLNSHLSPQTFTLRGWWVTSCLCQSFQPTFMLSWCLQRPITPPHIWHIFTPELLVTNMTNIHTKKMLDDDYKNLGSLTLG